MASLTEEDIYALLDACVEQGNMPSDTIKEIRRETGGGLKEAADAVILHGRKFRHKLTAQQTEAYRWFANNRKIHWSDNV